MNLRQLAIFIFPLVTCEVGYSQNSSQAYSSPPIKEYSQAELAALIKPGLSLTEVTNLFGPPGSEIPIDEHSSILLYNTDSSALFRQMQGSFLTGFILNLKDRKVVSWEPIITEVRSTAQKPEVEYAYGEHTFSFYLLPDSFTNLIRQFEVQGKLEVRTLATAPAFSFKARVFSGRGSIDETNRYVRLIIASPDVPKLSELTEKNVGKRVMIATGGQVVAVPVISTPIEYTQFGFEVRNAEFLK